MTTALQPEPRAALISDEGPWTPRDLNGLALRAGLGGFGLLAAWYQISEQTTLREQIPWLFAAVAATAVAGIAMTGWLTRGLRAVRAEHFLLRQILPAMLPESTGRTSPTTSAVEGDAWLSAAGMTLIHRPHCLFMRGKDAQPVIAAGRSRCPACAS